MYRDSASPPLQLVLQYVDVTGVMKLLGSAKSISGHLMSFAGQT
jgi:hypothetical protein